MSKGQSSLEFLALISMSALVVAALYGVMAAKQVDTAEYRNNRDALLVAENIGFQVEMAMVQGEGYSRVFSIPEDIAGQNYTVGVRDGYVILNHSQHRVTRPTLYNDTELQLATENANTFRVVNTENEIEVNPAS